MFNREFEEANFKPELGKHLTRIRKAHRLTQEQVAEILKIKRSTYAYYERNVTPSLEILDQLCTLFDVSLEELIYGQSRIKNLRLADPQIQKSKLDFSVLKEEERLIIINYRLLPDNLKHKIKKEIVELRNKNEGN